MSTVRGRKREGERKRKKKKREDSGRRRVASQASTRYPSLRRPERQHGGERKKKGKRGKEEKGEMKVPARIVHPRQLSYDATRLCPNPCYRVKKKGEEGALPNKKKKKKKRGKRMSRIHE